MEKTELIMLGTGHAMVTRCYNTCFALKCEEEYFLVDAGGGNGILVQIQKAGIPYERIHHMFITHAHTDHILGGIWVIRKVAAMMKKGDFPGDFTVYGHDKVNAVLRFMCDQMLPEKFRVFLDQRIRFAEIEDGESAEFNGMKITFFDILSTKEKQYGFQAVLSDGQRLVCLGDEPYQEKCRKYVMHADWMLCEAFCMEEDKQIYHPHEKHHSTALDAGKTADLLGVKKLVLYHTEDDDLSDRKRRYTKEVRTYYGGNVFVPDDLEKIDLSK